MSLVPGQIIDGKYRIIRLIGEGGMGSVHEGENTLISRRVAIKVLHAAAAGNEGVLKRFEREAQAAGRIGSDHILEVLDMGTLEDGDRYMVMEYLDGEELSARIERHGSLSPEQLAPLIQQTLVGLRAAHAAEIVHRDLKPDNIFILKQKAGQPDFVKIIDFGISKFNALTGDMSMTTTGAVMGTPFYMSPEQAKGAAGVDARTDLYAIGVIMYEALTGRVPFEGTSFNDLMFKIVLSEADPLPASIPLDFSSIVKKAMAREPEDRYQTADDLLAEVEAWLASRGLLGRESSSSINISQLAGSQLGGSQLVGPVPGGAHGAGATTHEVGNRPPTTKVAAARTDGNFAATNGDSEPAPSGAGRGKVALLVSGGLMAAAAAALAFIVARGSEPTEQAEQQLEPPPALSQPVEIGLDELGADGPASERGRAEKSRPDGTAALEAGHAAASHEVARHQDGLGADSTAPREEQAEVSRAEAEPSAATADADSQTATVAKVQKPTSVRTVRAATVHGTDTTSTQKTSTQNTRVQNTEPKNTEPKKSSTTKSSKTSVRDFGY